MPSATTNTPPVVSIRNASSLLARGPGWVTPCAVTPIASDYSRAVSSPEMATGYSVYSGRGDLYGPSRTHARGVGARTWPRRRSRPDPAAPPSLRIAPPRRGAVGARTDGGSVPAAGRPHAGGGGARAS